MILISHRGNTDGKFESYENEPNYIDKAIKEGFDVEVDIWCVDGLLYLGHDKPQYGVDFRWIRDRITKLWVHCKNLEALSYFKEIGYDVNYFWHENDEFTLTSRNYIWAYPSKENKPGTISVLPEIFDTPIQNCIGVCSDFIKKYTNV